MVSVGDKISISKTKTGYIGSKSTNPSVGNKIGNNEFGWKSGNPAVGNKIVINRDKQGRYLGWKSGGGIMCEDINPQVINITSSYKVCDSHSETGIPLELEGDIYYYTNGWSRDTDHEWQYGKYTDEISFNVIPGKRYWISSSPTSLVYISADDDFAIYINGTRTKLYKARPAAGAPIFTGVGFCVYDITDYLVEGTNTFKMFFKDWYGIAFSYSSVYILELDMTDNYPEYYEFNKTVIFGELGEYQYWSNKINVKRPSGTFVMVSSNPFSSYRPCMFDTYGSTSKILVYVNGTYVTESYFNMAVGPSIEITSYLPSGEYSDIQLMYQSYSDEYRITAVTQAWIYFVCT